jgi:hypothetical protein
LLVVGQAGARDGGYGGGNALVVDGEVSDREAVLARPLILVAEPQGLGEQRPLGSQAAGVLAALAGGSLVGMAAIPAGADQPGQQVPGQDENAAAENNEQP